MALAHVSIPTIDSPEFINLSPLDINPLMSSCDIKVFYMGRNDNGTFINKQTATELAKTLRGAPIVGYYKQDKQDFSDHGHRVILDDEGIKFECLTKPYGFVSPDAEVWFQKFTEQDRNTGEDVIREYLMTTGYLWTGQFPEAQQAYEEGKPESMELDKTSLEGTWAKEANSEIQFFIINSGIFSKLCILGDDVEPCFEGAGIGKDITAQFSKQVDNKFKNTLYSMMQDLEYVLKGGSSVADLDKKLDAVGEPTVSVDEELEVETSYSQKEEEVDDTTSEYKKDDDEDKDAEDPDSEKDDTQEDDSSAASADDEEKNNDADDKKRKYTLDELEIQYEELENKYNELNTSYSALDTEVQTLRKFKADTERANKENLIADFSMLTDEDKKDVIENIDNYSLDEIKSKLAVLCYDKKVNFNSEDSSENEQNMKDDNDITTYNLNNNNSTPDWVKAVKENM